MATPEHITRLIERSLRQEALTATEQAELRQWLQSTADTDSVFADADWEKNLRDYLHLDADEAQYQQALARFRAAAGISSGDSAIETDTSQPVHGVRPVHRVHFLKRWGWAAAILILLGAGAYLYTTRTTTESPLVDQRQPAANDILPGTNKALLTLSDGTTITLDSAANGAIARQGNSSIIKKANGEIIYDAKGHSAGAVMMNTMSTPRGGQYQLVLPDGSKVWLNAASSITYPVAFVGKDRRISISGEAYLEVNTDKTKPFIVDVDGQSTVEVLGTSFNINAYADEVTKKTTLIEGSVRVSSGTEKVILKPGYQAVSSVGKSEIKVNTSANIEQVLAWKNGYFSFENMGLREMARQIERWYDIQIKFPDEFSDVSLKGKMDRGVKLSGIMRFFSSYGFKTTLEGRVLVLTK